LRTTVSAEDDWRVQPSGSQKRKTKYPRLNSLTTLEVFSYQNSAVTITVEVYRRALLVRRNRNGEVRLNIILENSGENAITNLAIDCTTPAGISVSDPGMEVGTTRRHIRVPRLKVRQVSKYKLSLLPEENFQSGIVKIALTESLFRATEPIGEVFVGITST
jgi:hypothetical protein